MKNNVGIVTHVAAGGSQVDDGFCLGAGKTVSVDMSHDIVAYLSLPLAGGLIIYIIQVSAHLVKLFLLFCLPWMGLRFMGLDTGLAFWQVQLLTSLTLFVSNALPNVAGMGSVETAFLLVYSSFLPDASSMSLLMFYRLASYYAVFAASAVGFALAQRRLNRG